jgi:5-methylcytosine-specific restriction protein A
VVLVTGPPCAGKSSYVREHARPGDLVLDQDELGAAGMTRALGQVTAMADGTAWVIRCCPGRARRDQLAAQLRADVVHLQPPERELLARARQRRGVAAQVRAVRRWLADDANGGPGNRQDPQPVQRTAW